MDWFSFCIGAGTTKVKMMEEETVKPMTAEEYLIAYNTGYQAGLSEDLRDDDDAFWLRQYAGYAMQGQLSSLQTEATIMMFSEAMAERGLNPKYPERLIAINSVNYAAALLEEVKKHERS